MINRQHETYFYLHWLFFRTLKYAERDPAVTGIMHHQNMPFPDQRINNSASYIVINRLSMWPSYLVILHLMSVEITSVGYYLSLIHI